MNIKSLDYNRYLLWSALILILVSAICEWWIKKKYKADNPEEKAMVIGLVDYGLRILIINLFAMVIRDKVISMLVFNASVLIIGIYNYFKYKKFGDNPILVMSAVYLFLGIYGNIIINLFHFLID